MSLAQHPFPVDVTSEYLSGNVQPLLHEIRHALQALIESGDSTTIDLRGIPMAPGEEEHILDLLGEGEISATLNALGSSEIRETRFSGVWLITHRNTEGEVMGRLVEVTRIPAILQTQEADLAEGLEALNQSLEVHG